jgi:type I restriction-modification system DNA methylase subunit
MTEVPVDDDVSTDVDEIVEHLNSIHRLGHSYYQVFRDWIDLMLYALQRDDEQYLAVMDRYDNDGPRGEREADHFAAAFGELQKETANTGLDVLGDVYEVFGLQSDHLGQHFTPHAVADLLATLQHGIDGPVENVSDPACGSGRLLLYTAKRHPEAFYVGQDKDAVCAKMTALNLCMFNLDGYVVHGDTLRMERRNAWRTVSTNSGGSVREVVDDPVEETTAPVE